MAGLSFAVGDVVMLHPADGASAAEDDATSDGPLGLLQAMWQTSTGASSALSEYTHGGTGVHRRGIFWQGKNGPVCIKAVACTWHERLSPHASLLCACCSMTGSHCDSETLSETGCYGWVQAQKRRRCGRCCLAQRPCLAMRLRRMSSSCPTPSKPGVAE